MRLSTRAFVFTGIVLTLGLAGCGDSGGGGGGGGGEEASSPAPGEKGSPDPKKDQSGDATPEAPADAEARCDRSWKEMVAQHDPGRVTVFETVEITTGTGDEDLDGTVKFYHRETVKAASETAIELESEHKRLEPEGDEPMILTTTTEKTRYMEFCVLTPEEFEGVGRTDYGDASREVLEYRTESVQVRAGTFDTSFQKVRVVTDMFERDSSTVFETWVITGRGIVAKSLEHYDVKSETGSYKVERSMELVELK